MKKQVSILLGLCSGTKYLLCDETFDGLDPVVRQAVKSLFAAEILNRDFTPIISSHNLRELEDFCDSIGLLHQGQLLLTQSLDQIKCSVCKLQCVISDPHKEQQFSVFYKDIKNGAFRFFTYAHTFAEATQIFFLRYRLMILFLQKSFRLHSKKYL